ncbi:hypothetical protein L1887_17104 [Cichorium endivia]|nr:hypothetical protein L1887_17104 [Cichorium endivia]
MASSSSVINNHKTTTTSKSEVQEDIRQARKWLKWAQELVETVSGETDEQETLLGQLDNMPRTSDTLKEKVTMAKLTTKNYQLVTSLIPLVRLLEEKIKKRSILLDM